MSLSSARPPSVQRQGRRRTGRSLLAFALTLVMVILVVRLALPNAQALARAGNWLDQIGLWLMMLRLTAIGLLWACWRPLVSHLFRDAGPAARAALQARRHSLALFLVVIELALIQNVFGQLWSTLR